ncbi:hypothetical protein B5M09_006198 [Aphanomyces astaci]|uniref:Uncharacterized protein n=1 Tax=Aphanomyces astaci TaxID=112090 RepID=A0A3R7YH57_APHAT|nr:hypothetical protein B5M09_006198 [Aphanomyces astaci]
MVPLQSVTSVTKINLGPLMYTPRNPDGSRMSLGDKAKPGQVQDGTVWKFRVGLSERRRDDWHDRWLKALCRTTKRPVLVQTSPNQFQIKLQPVLVA